MTTKTSSESEIVTNGKIGRTLRICLEGNIGVGKTTLCEELKKTLISEYNFQPQDVFIFKEEIDMDMLHQFNEDPVKYAESFQTSMMKARLKNISKAHQLYLSKLTDAKSECVIILDTGMLRELVFTHANYLLKRISKEFVIQHFKDFQQSLAQESNNNIKQIGWQNLDPVPPAIEPEFTFVLTTTPSFCLKNIQTRHRDNENLISLDYLVLINDMYKAYTFAFFEKGKVNPFGEFFASCLSSAQTQEIHQQTVVEDDKQIDVDFTMNRKNLMLFLHPNNFVTADEILSKIKLSPEKRSN